MHSWAPRTILGVKFGGEKWFRWYPAMNFRIQNPARVIRFWNSTSAFGRPLFRVPDVWFLDYQCRRCEGLFVEFPVIWLTSSVFFSGSAAVGAALSNPPTPEGTRRVGVTEGANSKKVLSLKVSGARGLKGDWCQKRCNPGCRFRPPSESGNSKISFSKT